MFESTIDLTEIRSVLTDAGHTVVGFATLAFKKGNEVRLDTAKTFESQFGDLRSQALAFIEKADEAASEIEDRLEPLVNRMSERLPAPAASVALTLQHQSRALRTRAHDVVVGALRNESGEKSSPAAKSPPRAAKKASVAKAGTKIAAAKAPVKKVVAKAPVKKVVAKKAVIAKAVVAKKVGSTAPAKKATARTSAVKASARKAGAR